MGKKSLEDWAAIERDYRAGMLTVKEIARRHGLSDVSVYNKIKKLGWTQDLSTQVRKATKAKLQREELANVLATDREVIERASTEAAEIIKLQRKDIAELRALEAELKDQLAHDLKIRRDMTANQVEPELLARFIELGIKVPTLGQCSGVFRDIAQAQAKRIPLERKAYNLDDEGDNSTDPVQQLLDEIDGMTRVPPSIRDAG